MEMISPRSELIGHATDCPLCHGSQTIDTFEKITPVSCEYIDSSVVKFTARTADGQLVHATMTATSLLSFVNMATAMINDRTAQLIASVI